VERAEVRGWLRGEPVRVELRGAALPAQRAYARLREPMTAQDPLEGLEKVPWQRLETSGGGRATALPRILRRLAEIRDPEAWLKAYGELPARAYLTHSHGPYVSEAAAYAVPFVMALLPLVSGPLPPYCPPGSERIELLLFELVSICNGIVPSRQDHLEQVSRWGGNVPRVPSEEVIAREHQILQRARSVVRRELDRLLVYIDHPGPQVRGAMCALAQALPEERERFEPLLWRRLVCERDSEVRSWLLLALDGEATSMGAEKHPRHLPLSSLLTWWESETLVQARIVLAYLLVMRLQDEAPRGCFPLLAQAMGQGGLTLSRLGFWIGNEVHGVYLPLRGQAALEALVEVFEQGQYRSNPGALGLLLHVLSGDLTPSPWLPSGFGSPPHHLDVPKTPLAAFPDGPLGELQERVLGVLAASDWFWPWGSDMLQAYGLPPTREALREKLG
jgi:hypothetical protein